MKYKIIRITNNSGLFDQVVNCFNTKQPMSSKIIKIINENNKFYFNIENIKKNKTEFIFTYFCLDENRIPCAYFSHSYNLNKNDIYLSLVEVSPYYRRKGLATKAYKIIKQDIINMFNPKEFTAFFVSNAGNKFGEKIGFKSDKPGMSYLKNKDYEILKVCKNIKQIKEYFENNNVFEI